MIQTNPCAALMVAGMELLGILRLRLVPPRLVSGITISNMLQSIQRRYSAKSKAGPAKRDGKNNYIHGLMPFHICRECHIPRIQRSQEYSAFLELHGPAEIRRAPTACKPTPLFS